MFNVTSITFLHHSEDKSLSVFRCVDPDLISCCHVIGRLEMCVNDSWAGLPKKCPVSVHHNPDSVRTCKGRLWFNHQTQRLMYNQMTGSFAFCEDNRRVVRGQPRHGACVLLWSLAVGFSPDKHVILTSLTRGACWHAQRDALCAEGINVQAAVTLTTHKCRGAAHKERQQICGFLSKEKMMGASGQQGCWGFIQPEKLLLIQSINTL